MDSGVHLMLSDRIIYSCNNANCHEPIDTGRCKEECWRRYREEKKTNTEDKFAYWEHRAKHNDYLWVQCSNCGFRVENYTAVVLDGCDTKFKDVKYKFCPICGKEMRVKNEHSKT